VIWLARSLWLVTAVLALVSALLGVLFPGIYEALGDDSAGGVFLYATIGLVGVGYASAGLLILRHRPRHAVGWLLLTAGPMVLVVFLSFAVGFRLATEGEGLGLWLLVFSYAGFWPALLLAGPMVALLFPDGRLPGRHWRWPVRIAVGAVVAGLVLNAVRPGSLDEENDLAANPIGMSFLPEWLVGAVEASGTVVLLGAVALGVLAVIVRFRRAGPDERQQLKWLVFAAVIWAAILPISLGSGSILLAALSVGTLLLLPAAIVIAITRYRLYEIDALINRTLVYVSLVGIVAGLYAASVVLFQRIFVAATGNTSDAAAIISALLLAAVFTPIRKSIEAVVDRRFKPAAADAAHPSVPSAQWEDPAFEAAVERVVRRVLRE
jgi:hypothetical protein